MRTTINWQEVRHLMIDKGIQSYAQLARRADINKNTMGRVGPFSSPTLDRLATCLECDPCKLIKVDDDDPPTDDLPIEPPAPKASDAARQTQRSALAPPGAQATPQQLAAEAERRQMLLAQAEGRREGNSHDGK